MNTDFGFAMTIVMSLLIVALTLVFKAQNNTLYFRLGLITTSVNILGRVLFYPLLAHPEAKFLWYLTWVLLELPFIAYIAFHVYKTKWIDGALFLLAFISIAGASVNFFRFIERHYTDWEIIKSLYPYSATLVSIATISVLISVAFNPPETSQSEAKSNA